MDETAVVGVKGDGTAVPDSSHASFFCGFHFVAEATSVHHLL